MSELYRRRPVTDRHEQRVKGLYETSNSKGLHWEVKTWNKAESKEHWVRLPAVDREDAIQLAYRQHGSDEAEKPVTKKLRLRDAKAEFLSDFAKSRAPGTLRQRKEHLTNHILPVLGGYYFSEVEANKRLVMKVIDAVQEKGLAAGTVASVWTSLSAFLSWACEPTVEYMKSNPCHAYKADKLAFRADAAKAVSIDEVPSVETIGWLLQDERGRNKQQARMFEFAYETGMRISEIIGLMQTRVDMKRKVILVTHQMGSNTEWPNLVPLKGDLHRGGGQMRVIPMSERCLEIVREQLAYQMARKQGGGYLFSSKHETPFHQSTAQKMLYACYERCGIERAGSRLWHGFRHAYATRLFALGVPIERISRYLGHSTVEMTRSKYIAFIDQAAEHDEYRRVLAEAAAIAS